MGTTYLGPERRVRLRRRDDEPEIIAVEISTDHIREAILFAVAHGWRPTGSSEFEDEERPTTPDLSAAYQVVPE